jgi:hypothetical protein
VIGRVFLHLTLLFSKDHASVCPTLHIFTVIQIPHTIRVNLREGGTLRRGSSRVIVAVAVERIVVAPLLPSDPIFLKSTTDICLLVSISLPHRQVHHPSCTSVTVNLDRHPASFKQQLRVPSKHLKTC